MSNRFTNRSQKVLNNAMNVAAKLGSAQIGTEHLLAGLLMENEGMAAQLLAAMGFDARDFMGRLQQSATAPQAGQQLEYSPRSKRAIDLARAAASELQVNYIGTEHLLLGILREGEGYGAKALKAANIEEENIVKILSGQGMPGGGEGGAMPHSGPAAPGNKQGKTPELDKASRDLTRMAVEGELDPVIGREREIERVVQILSRRTKNNPVLIGEPGVGKTAIAEGLAQRIVAGTVPHNIIDKRVVSLDMSSVVAGTKYRGEFEERLQKVLTEIRNSKDVILFIDELHNLIGAGSAEGSMDAANILKPALSRGELQCVGATTLDEYRKHIEKDAALERRFQPVYVEEPTPEETLAILRGLKDNYEAHHRVTIGEDALEAAVRLSTRYISDRFLPDKAIDLIDEASSRVRITSYKAPPDLKEMEDALAEAIREKESAANNQEYEEAARLRDKATKLQEELEAKKSEWQKEQVDAMLAVTPDDIADVVSLWTKIPVSRLQMEEKERLLNLEETLHKRLVGQDEAVKAVAGAIRRAGAGLKSAHRPIGSFLFLGPTGVGKTELAKALAEAVFGSEENMVRIDMSEYMERFAVSRLVGAPPGYVGYDEGGQLTEAVRRNPYSVILLDEIEKAHPDVFNILLQVLDDGRLTDSLGRTVDFRNAIVIMTSNVGAKHVYGGNKSMGFTSSDLGDSFGNYESLKEKYLSDLKGTFRPEFLNRVDDIIVFHALQEEDILAITSLLLREVEERLAEQKVSLVVDDEAKKYLVKTGFDPAFGARPLRRTIQQKIEDPLADAILAGEFSEGDTIQATLADDAIVFSK